MSPRRRRWLVPLLTLLIATCAAEGRGFWTAPGVGSSAANSGSLVAATISTPATATNSITLTWSQQASLVPSSAANGDITYTVERKLGSGSYAALSSGGCSATKTYAITSCSDAPGASGSYSYRVVAHVATWTATSVESGPVALSVDATAPTVQSISRAETSPTNATSVSWTVTFSEPVTGVDAGDFALAASGPTATSISSITGSGATYTVTAATGSGSGTLGLNLADDDTITDAATNKLAGTGTANGNLTGQTYTIDKTAPTAPSAISATSGVVWGTTSCTVTSGTRYINGTTTSASASTVAMSANVTPETGLTIVFTATSGATSVTSARLADAASPVVTTQNLSTLLDGTITLTAYTVDVAGNASTTTTSAATLIKDVVIPPLTASYSGGFLGLSPTVSGSSECGATVVTTKTAGGNTGATWQTTIASGTSYSIAVEGPLLGLSSVTYSTVSRDRAANASGAVISSG